MLRPSLSLGYGLQATVFVGGSDKSTTSRVPSTGFSGWQGELKMATSLRLMRECDTSKQTSKEYSLVVKNRPIAVKSVSSSDSIKVKCRIASEDLPSYFCQLPAREDVRKSHFERRQSHLKCGFFCSRSSQYQEIEGATLDQKELIRTALHQEEEVDLSYFIV